MSSETGPTARRWISPVRLGRMIKKELRQLLRDPKARPIIFVAPVVQLLLLGYAATSDVKDIRTVVVDHDRTADSRALVEAHVSTGYFRVISYGDRADLVASALDRGEAVVGLIIPPGFSRDLRSGQGAQVQAVIDGSDASVASVAQGYVGRITNGFGAKAVARPHGASGVELRSRAWFNPSLESRLFNIPAVMGTLLMMSSLLLTALAVVRERESGTLDQLLVSPLTPTEFMVGKTVPVLGIGIVHLTIFTSLSLFWFDVPLRGSLWALVLAALLFILAGLALGLLMSTVSHTQQEAFMLLILFFLPGVILSGFLSPVESMPTAFQVVTLVNPIRHFMVILRGVFLKGVGVAELWPQYMTLAAMAAGALLLAIRRYRHSIA
jgi:ABC-2 type transport system permease protein